MRSIAQEEAIVAGQTNLTDAERAEIGNEMQRVLANPRFNSSQRCAKLLQHLVQRVLEGDCESLKERTLGTQVFGRDASYDTSADPVVRITASEIRKRLALYYQDPNHIHSVRIELAAGGYHPTFSFGPQQLPLETVETEVPVSSTANDVSNVPAEIGAAFRLKWIIIGVASVAALLSLFWILRLDFFQSTSYLVWKPLLGTNRTIIVCVSDFDESGNTNRNLGSVMGVSGKDAPTATGPLLPLILLEDARTATKITDQLTRLGQSPKLESASAVSLKEFRGASVVLIGGLNNPWSMKLLAGLRYQVRRDPATGDRWIEDSLNPANQTWKVNSKAAQPDMAYAVLTRFQDPETGGWVMAMTGTGPLGVEAGADMITAPGSVNSLPTALRTKKNFQVVMKASVVNRVIGSPQILTIHTF